MKQSGILVLLMTCSSVLTNPIDPNQMELNHLLQELQRQRLYESAMHAADDRNDFPDYEQGFEAVDLMTRVRKGAGNCYAMGKCLYYSKRLKTEFCGNCGNRQRCFPGDASVQLERGGRVSMSQLKLHDKILAANRSGALTYSEVVAWLYRGSNITEQYVSVSTASGHRVQLSSNHVVFTTDRHNTSLVSRFAGELVNGNLMKTVSVRASGDGKTLVDTQISPVVSIATTIKQGAYVPLTATGSMFVDGVLVSCYASFNHDWAHLMASPLRLWPHLFPGLTSTHDGPRDAVQRLKAVGRWLFPTSAVHDATLIHLQLPQTLQLVSHSH